MPGMELLNNAQISLLVSVHYICKMDISAFSCASLNLPPDLYSTYHTFDAMFLSVCIGMCAI